MSFLCIEDIDLPLPVRRKELNESLLVILLVIKKKIGFFEIQATINTLQPEVYQQLRQRFSLLVGGGKAPDFVTQPMLKLKYLRFCRSC
jgi:hypothetical protein